MPNELPGEQGTFADLPSTEAVERFNELASRFKFYGRGDSGQPLIDEARIEGVFRAIAQNQGTTYTGTYTSRRTQGYALKPGEDANTRMLNDLLSDGLNRAFSDPELGRLLAR